MEFDLGKLAAGALPEFSQPVPLEVAKACVPLVGGGEMSPDCGQAKIRM